jgi:hypothetical protein
MGNARFRTLRDFAKREANVGAVCGHCGRKGIVHRDVLAAGAVSIGSTVR